VDDEVRAVVKQSEGFFMDFFGAFLAPLEEELQLRSAHVRGRGPPGAAADPAHSARIDATNFALANDDGAGARDYRSADLILLGVSRTSKTPTSLYLALQYGIFTANYPLADEDLETGRLPKMLQPYLKKLHGLTIRSERLQQIRQERRPGSRYASPQQVQYEVRTALGLFERHGVPWIDVTECSVEEIASRILDRMHLARHVRQ
jgi:regulator of PEP synthase PpsR (kinase-PPPase family)